MTVNVVALDRGGYSRMLAPGRRPYRTRDGWICVLVYTDKHWRRFFAGMDALYVRLLDGGTGADTLNIAVVTGQLPSAPTAVLAVGGNAQAASWYMHSIDPATGEVLPEGSEGELVFTSLTKEALPIIRYRTKDLTRLLPGTARPAHRRMGRITGRSDDMIILRGVNLLGINSVLTPRATRLEVWRRIAGDLRPAHFLGLHARVLTGWFSHEEMRTYGAHDDRLDLEVWNSHGDGPRPISASVIDRLANDQRCEMIHCSDHEEFEPTVPADWMKMEVLL